jgi:Apoptosis inhibitory protein 5 (API5)
MLIFQRREALRRLISLTRTASRELKVFAAQNFSHYFKDFPDLEEDVIDSVYDICEDPDAQVTRMSHSCGCHRPMLVF